MLDRIKRLIRLSKKDPEALAKRERYNDLMAAAKKLTTFPGHEGYVTRLKERAKEDGIEQFSVWSNPSLHDHLDEAEELVATYLGILEEVKAQDEAAELTVDDDGAYAPFDTD